MNDLVPADPFGASYDRERAWTSNEEHSALMSLDLACDDYLISDLGYTATTGYLSSRSVTPLFEKPAEDGTPYLRIPMDDDLELAF